MISYVVPWLGSVGNYTSTNFYFDFILGEENKFHASSNDRVFKVR